MTPDQAAKLHTCLNAMPGGRWGVWTSNSFRRITASHGGRSGPDGGVLHAYCQPSDGHPDLSMTESELRALCELRNTVAEMLDRVE